MFSTGASIVERRKRIDTTGRTLAIIKYTSPNRVEIVAMVPAEGKILHIMVFKKM
jgi:hypothetical protein